MNVVKVRECPKCRYNNPVNAWFCELDGTTLSVDTILEKEIGAVESENLQIRKGQSGPYSNSKHNSKSTHSVPTPTRYEEKELINNIENNAKALADALALEQYWYPKAIEAIDSELRSRQDEIRLRYSKILKQEKYAYDEELSRLKSELTQITTNYGLAELEWDAPQWRNYSPTSSSNIPRLTRIGSFFSKGGKSQLQLTALLPLIGSRNFVIKASGSGKDRARSLIQSITLRLIGTLPPGKLRLICIDPVGLGSTVAGFIKGLPDFLTGGQALFEQRAIEEKLTELERHMAFVKQKYLGVSYQTMEEYNEKAGQIEEPYRLLIISDFPTRFSDSAAQQLISIATNGPGTGVYAIAMVDTDHTKMPYGFNINDLERTATVISANSDGNTWHDSDFKECALLFDGVPPSEAFEKIVDKVGNAAIAAGEIKVPFSNFVPSELELWSGDTRKGISIPIGHFGARETQLFNFDEKLLSSALVIGKTGSGKSTLLHILINSLALKYSPEELELYLLDFKQVEFKDYALYGLPHARVIAVKSEREFGISVLRGLDTELQRRKDSFGNITLLSEYRYKNNQKLPRILLIADEFQELFTYDDSLAREAEMILDRLVRQGRAFGINIILSSQTLSGPNTFSSATRNQIPLRVAMQCADSDSRLILSDDNDRAKYLERPGEAIYNAANGRLEGNNRFQVAWLDEKDRKDIIQRVRAMTDRLSNYSYRKPMVFDGDASAKAENNSELMELIHADHWPESTKRRHSPEAWIGEPIEIKSHTALPFKRQSRSNLLIIGQNEYEETTVAMLMMSVFSLACQHKPDAAQFAIMNLIDVDSQYYSLPGSFVKSLPHDVVEIRRRGIVEEISEIAQEVQKRIASNEEIKWPSVYLIILGLHRARDLRRDDDIGFGSTNEINPPELLSKIICEGPDVGVHTLIWCDTYSNLLRFLERRTISEFDFKVAMQMSPDDSRSLIDSDIANKLGLHRAIFYDEEHSGRFEKFRPYSLPNTEWLLLQTSKLRKRTE